MLCTVTDKIQTHFQSVIGGGTMRRILSIAGRDLRSSLRDFIAIYIIIAPIGLAFLIAGFVPTTETASVKVAVDTSVEAAVITSLEEYVEIERYETREALEERVVALDDLVGLASIGDGIYEIIREGNEQDDTTELINNLLIKYQSEIDGDVIHFVEVDFSSIGTKESPVGIIGLVSMAVLALVLGGMVISMNIIEEKENKTFSALNSTPLTRAEYITGKSLAGSIIAVVQIISMFFIFGYNDVNFLQVLFISIAGLSIVIIMGFILGLVSPSQMAAIANMKILFLPISIAIIGAILLPASQHFVLWWIPFYWVYDGMTAIINGTATWGSLSIDALGVIIITVIIYFIFRKKINQNLQS